MLKLLKYLKQSVGPMLLILALLVVQAVSDLSLPEYTSRIVNVGIQQSGIDKAAPEQIRQASMDKLSLFMSKADYDKVLTHYSGSAPVDNPDEAILYLDEDTTKEELDELNSILSMPMLVTANLESNPDVAKDSMQQMLSSMPKEAAMALPSDADIFSLLSMLTDDQRSQVITELNNKFSDMPESIIEQTAISYTKLEYEAIGVDTGALQSRYIMEAGIYMLLLAFLSMAASIGVGYLSAKVAAKLGLTLRGRVFEKVVSFSNTEIDKFSTASLITRSTNDIQQVQMFAVMLLRIVFYAPIVGIGGVIKVLGTNSSMAWIIAVAVIVILSVVLVLFATVMPRFKLLQKLLDKLNLVAREVLTGLPVIRAFSTQKHEEKRFDEANSSLRNANQFVNRVMSGMMPMMMLIMNVICIVIMWNGAHGINNGEMQVGDLMAFIQYTMQIIMAFLMISMFSIMLPRAAVSATRVDEILTTENAITDPKLPRTASRDKKGFIEFKNVSFRYPNAEEDVINNVSFTAKPGETTAFIGSTGSGKSTLINLIPRFYDATEGEILVDGVNVKELSTTDLRDKIGYVPQKGVLFSGTIESNLKFSGEVSDDVMKKAAEISQSSDFISEKPELYQEPISQGGTNVSGGQKQRLSIARAIAKQPEIYIFDDSFSALDYKTDVLLRKALKAHTAESTVLIVAQRISTIIHAEQIIVLDEGKVIGKGTHKELLKSCEVYEQIALSQLSKEELDNE